MAMITVPRSGDAPLRFAGDRLADASSHRASGYRQNRWHELAMYRATSGDLVAHVHFSSTWEAEDSRDTAEVHSVPDSLIAWLRGYDPCDDYYGFPEGPQYAAKQERLDAEVRAGYEQAVAAVLADADIHASLDEWSTLRRQRDERRYRALLDGALSEVRLTVPEASLVCDALNGHGTMSMVDREEPGRDADWAFWRASVADAVAQNGANEKWGVDWPALGAKLAALTDVQQLAIADAVERWWASDDRDTTADSLSAVGLVRDPPRRS